MATPQSTRFAADGVLVLGGGRAILLQIADPVVAAGVRRQSDFSHRPLARLHNTLTFVYAVMLGTPHEAELVAGFVAREHAPVAGAADADRQLWVAATLYETAMRVHRVVHGPLADETAEGIYRDYERLGTVLQLPAGAWPENRAAFDRYWADTVAHLQVTDDARAIAHDLFHPASAPVWLRAALPLAELITASLLPAALRTAYGIDWTPGRRRRALIAWGVIRSIARLLPYRVRAWPSRHYLRRLRARAAASSLPTAPR